MLVLSFKLPSGQAYIKKKSKSIVLHGLTTLESPPYLILGFVLILPKNVYFKEINTDKWDTQGY